MDYSILVNTIADQVKEYGDIQAQRAKLYSGLVANKIKAKQNFFFKQQEQAAKERRAQELIQPKIAAIRAAREARMNPNGQIHPFRETPPYRTGIGAKGNSVIRKPLDRKDYFFQRIQEKKDIYDRLKAQGDPRADSYALTKAEKAYEKKYLGIGGSNIDIGLKKAVDRIRSGEDTESVISDLKRTYPGKITSTMEDNLYDIEPESGSLDIQPLLMNKSDVANSYSEKPEYEVGRIYSDKSGRKARYLGNGKWELQE
jgi:hypothetical protein